MIPSLELPLEKRTEIWERSMRASARLCRHCVNIGNINGSRDYAIHAAKVAISLLNKGC
jgi:hypothetical protein